MPRKNSRPTIVTQPSTKEEGVYKILSTTNLLNPVAGSLIKKAKLEAYMRGGVKVVVVPAKK